MQFAGSVHRIGRFPMAAPAPPAEVRVGGELLDSAKYDYAGRLLRVRFPNSAEPVTIEVRLAR